MGKIERLALRRPFRDVEEDDVAKLFQRREMSQGSADLTGSDQCDLTARHELLVLFVSTQFSSVDWHDVCGKPSDL